MHSGEFHINLNRISIPQRLRSHPWTNDCRIFQNCILAETFHGWSVILFVSFIWKTIKVPFVLFVGKLPDPERPKGVGPVLVLERYPTSSSIGSSSSSLWPVLFGGRINAGCYLLGGNSNICGIFIPKIWDDSQFDSYFLNGLKPPTSYRWDSWNSDRKMLKDYHVRNIQLLCGHVAYDSIPSLKMRAAILHLEMDGLGARCSLNKCEFDVELKDCGFHSWESLSHQLTYVFCSTVFLERYDVPILPILIGDPQNHLYTLWSK